MKRPNRTGKFLTVTVTLSINSNKNLTMSHSICGPSFVAETSVWRVTTYDIAGISEQFHDKALALFNPWIRETPKGVLLQTVKTQM